VKNLLDSCVEKLNYDLVYVTLSPEGVTGRHRSPRLDQGEAMSNNSHSNGSIQSSAEEQPGSLSFESVLQIDVPKGRDGKHKQIVLRLLGEIEHLKPGMALKIPLSELPDSKENIRSALSRAAHQKEIAIATSSNDEFLYVWKTDKP
jgi:hypothetical protein